MDEGEQQPVITHVLGNNESEYETKKSNMLKRISRYNSGMKPGKHQITTGSPPAGPTDINKEDFLNMEVKVPTTSRDIIPTPDIDESEGTTINLNPSL